MDKLFISVMTYELVKEFFDCEYYGRVPVKYTGDLELFVIKSLNIQGLNIELINKKIKQGVLNTKMFGEFEVLCINDLSDIELRATISQIIKIRNYIQTKDLKSEEEK